MSSTLFWRALPSGNWFEGSPAKVTFTCAWRLGQLVNVDRRRWPPVDVAARLVILAQKRGDNLARSAPPSVCDWWKLREAIARRHVQHWAAHLDAVDIRYSDGDSRVLKQTCLNMWSGDGVGLSARPASRNCYDYHIISIARTTILSALAVLPPDAELVHDYQVAQDWR